MAPLTLSLAFVAKGSRKITIGHGSSTSGWATTGFEERSRQITSSCVTPRSGEILIENVTPCHGMALSIKTCALVVVQHYEVMSSSNLDAS